MQAAETAVLLITWKNENKKEEGRGKEEEEEEDIWIEVSGVEAG
jgi:hypothetical protein